MNANRTNTTETKSTSTPADLFFQTKAEANEPTLKQLAQEVNALQEQIVANDALAANHGRIALDCAYQAGRRLNRAKSIIGDGEWMDWVTNNIKGVTHRTVNRYMSLATKLEGKYNSTTFDDFTSLREAYMRVGIISKKEKKEKTRDKQPQEPSPETLKATNLGQYNVSLSEAQQTIQAAVQTDIERFNNRIDWSLSTWSLKNNRPCSDGSNNLECLFNILGNWASLRGFESSLTVADETSTKVVVILNEVAKKILLANSAASQISPEVVDLKRLEDFKTGFDLSKPEPIEVADATPVLAKAA